jgi:hypothetical protein
VYSQGQSIQRHLDTNFPIRERVEVLPRYAGLVTLVCGPLVGNAAFREQNQRSALWPTRCKRIPQADRLARTVGWPDEPSRECQSSFALRNRETWFRAREGGSRKAAISTLERAKACHENERGHPPVQAPMRRRLTSGAKCSRSSRGYTGSKDFMSHSSQTGYRHRPLSGGTSR